MPNIQFGVITKRLNSIGNSFDHDSVTLSCKLKEPCSLMRPIFQVQGLSDSKMNQYNYCKWGDMCYWIDDITYTTNNIVEVTCHKDSLGTYGAQVKQYGRGFINYTSDTSQWNKQIDDTRLAPEIQSNLVAELDSLNTKFPLVPEYNSDASVIPFAGIGGGTAVIRVVSLPDSSAVAPVYCGVITVAMSMTDLQNCLADLSSILISSGSSSADMKELSCKLWGAIGGSGSWSDNILSMTYVPIDMQLFIDNGTKMNDLWVGGVKKDVSGMSVYCVHHSLSAYGHKLITIPWSTKQGTLPFLKNPRWCSLQLIYPGGCIPIDITNLKDQTRVGWWVCMNVTTGEWAARITERGNSPSQALAVVGGSVGVDIRGMVNTQSRDSGFIASLGLAAGLGLGVASGAGIIAAAQMGLTGMGIGAGIGGDFNGRGNPISAGGGSLNSGNTSMYACDVSSELGMCNLALVSYYPNAMNDAYYSDYYDSFCAKHGYPCNKFMPFSSLAAGAYIQCSQVSYDPPAGAPGIPAADLAAINQALNTTGVYLS